MSDKIDMSLASREISLTKKINPKGLTPARLFKDDLILAELRRCYSDVDGRNMPRKDVAKLFNLRERSLEKFLRTHQIVKTPEMIRQGRQELQEGYYTVSSGVRLEIADHISNDVSDWMELINAFKDARIPETRINSWKHLCAIEGVKHDSKEGYDLQESFMMNTSGLKGVLDVVGLCKIPVLNESNINVSAVESQAQIAARMEVHLATLKAEEATIELFDVIPEKKDDISDAELVFGDEKTNETNNT